MLRRHRSRPARRQGEPDRPRRGDGPASTDRGEARHGITDAAEDVDGGGPRMVIVEQGQEPLQCHVGISLAERAGDLDEDRVPVVEAGVLQLVLGRRRHDHREQRLEQFDAAFVDPAVLSFHALVEARQRPERGGQRV